ncbi:RluA family pseudouridine synthase [Polaromonas sp. A23]|uniref:RluA family pseudouridine synthase n=1 Tax=Polaromonas sp. A23 TaxID=1944133 RepID=UPI000984354A|nr:RluA family pseudouridine synthase [Polaromonas sp. A23]OOG37877.1 pseudouridine synthase [Polaromonas sp. A23]
MTDSVQSKLIISSAAAGLRPGDDVLEDGEATVETEWREVNVPVESHGARLDRALAAIVPEFSRSYLQQLIDAAAVQLNGVTVTKTSTKVKAGDDLKIELRPTPQSQAFKPEIIPLDVVFEDDHLLVINKPAGLVVHPAPGNWSGTLLNGLLARDEQVSTLPRAGIVHRLDKDTSGLMVVARRRQVMDQLVSMIAERSVSREYLALVHGVWQGPKGRRIEAPMGRDPRNRLRMTVVDLEKNAGKTASTDLYLLQQEGAFCLVRCRLHTGRTHQIRVHMAFIGHPLVSDEVYGGKPAAGMTRQALHACRLAFIHPVTGESLEFTAPPPEDMLTALEQLGLGYNQVQ